MILDDSPSTVASRSSRARARASGGRRRSRSPRRAPTSCARRARRPTSTRPRRTCVHRAGARWRVATDVTVTEQLERLVAATVDELGRLDILVNNAGGWLPRPLLETSERSFEAALRFNVTSAFLLTKLAVPHLAANGAGSIVNISSRAASMVQPCLRRLRDREGGAVDDDACDGARARTQDPRQRDRGRRRRDRGARARARRRRHPPSARGQHADAPRRPPGRHRGRGRLPRVARVVVRDRQDLRGRRRRRGPRLHDPLRPCSDCWRVASVLGATTPSARPRGAGGRGTS